MSLVLKDVSLSLAEFDLEVNLELHRQTTVVFGPSGAGKTTLLDIIAGLRRPASAQISLNGRMLTDIASKVHVPPPEREIGYVPQDLALFPHLSVRRNLLYGCSSRREEAHSTRTKKVQSLLASAATVHGPNAPTSRLDFDHIVDLLELAPLVHRRIPDLSGGEKQRVALGRALLSSPSLLLLDEPLANLDFNLKSRIIPYLLRIRKECGIPMLYVTHDRFETLSLAEDIVVMAQGRVIQTGPVHEVFSRPANLSAAGILTVETVQPGRIVSRADGLALAEVGTTRLYALDSDLPVGVSEVHVCIRAEDVILLPGADRPASARNHLSATVRAVAREGPLMRIDLECGFPLTALLTKQACEELALHPGSSVVALVKAPNVHIIPSVIANSGKNY